MSENKSQNNFDWSNISFNLHDLLTSFALLLCGLSLALVAIRLGPVAKWANYQSTCVEAISSKYPIEYAVRKCNGRSKVYQVK
tara:strand:+ start:461 stop:709 length:249 start_codon:yes stop_codon:yes gene_type:complete